MTSKIEFIKTEFDKAEYLQSMLLARGTGGDANDDHYIQIRHELMSNPNYGDLLPRWLKINRNLDQYWQYIKNKFPSYAERRAFLYEELNPILEYLETKQTLPAAKSIDEVLSKFDSNGIHFAWQKALERKSQDPAGAIIISRSILESVCKHILHGLGVGFNEKILNYQSVISLHRVN